MKLDQLSAVAQIVSAVAIVATVAYLAVQTQQLAIQTQQNTLAIQATVRQAMLDSDRAMLSLQVEYPSITIARDTGIELTDEDAVQLANYLNTVVRV